MESQKKKGVIYTCITGNYDQLNNHVYIDHDWDYICFTDSKDNNKSQNGWVIKSLMYSELDDVRNARWHKLHPHILFPNYEKSIWIDGNIDIVDEGFFCDIENAIINNRKMSIAIHPDRNCIYDELQACIYFAKDDLEIMNRQVEKIRDEGFPAHYGLFETNIIYREHHNQMIVKIMEDWWKWIQKYSRRDQLSLTYVLWKNNYKVLPLDEVSYRNSHKVKFTYSDNMHVTKEELIAQKKQLQDDLGNKILELQKKEYDLQVKEHELQVKKQELQVKEYELQVKDHEITLMKSSKFWKMRDRYMKLKNLRMQYIIDLSKKALFVLKRDGILVFVKYAYKYMIHGRKYFKNQIESTVVQNYNKWIEKNESFDIARIKNEIEGFKLKPLISIVVPVFNVESQWLDKCINSVVNQFYENWELCIHDDASTNKETLDCLKKWESKDRRIKISYGKSNQHISGASNDALKIATGDYVALLDNDDELSENALYENVKLINISSNADFIFSDEDKIDENGVRVDPYFKPDWSLPMFLSMNYTCHLSVFRKSIIDKIGGFRVGYEGSQDYDLTLRFIESIDKNNIYHIPKILYHWRKIPGSTAQKTDSKNYAYVAAKKALSDHINRSGKTGIIEDGVHMGLYNFKEELRAHPLVSIVVPTKDKLEYLKPCILSILKKTEYQNYEIIILDTGSIENETLQFYRDMHNENRINIVNYPKKEFNFAEANTWATRYANGEYLLFLNNDTEVINNEWLTEMVRCAQIENVGIVGAKLLFPNNTIQHMGIVVGLRNGASHAGILFPEWQLMGFPFLHAKDVRRNVSAVTGACLLIKKDIFHVVGGFDKTFKIAFNDTDLCLKVREKGYDIIYTPFAKLIHYESVTFGRPYEDPSRSTAFFEKEQKMFNERWKKNGFNDPFYNVNLTLKDESLNLQM